MEGGEQAGKLAGLVVATGALAAGKQGDRNDDGWAEPGTEVGEQAEEAAEVIAQVGGALVLEGDEEGAAGAAVAEQGAPLGPRQAGGEVGAVGAWIVCRMTWLARGAATRAA